MSQKEKSTTPVEFAGELALGDYRHLTPKPSIQCVLTLEMTSQLYLEERERSIADTNYYIVSMVVAFMLVGGVASFLMLSVTESLLESIAVTLAFALFWLLMGLVAIPAFLVSLAGRLSASKKAKEYEVRISGFLRELDELAASLHFGGRSVLKKKTREELSERAREIGVKDAFYIKQQEEQSELPQTREQMLAFRKRLARHYDICARFDLLRGGYTELFRAAEALMKHEAGESGEQTAAEA